MAFADLHVHTEHSVLDGLTTTAEAARRAAENGSSHLAITDHGGCFGHVQFQRDCLAQGISPVFGIETYFQPDRLARPAEGDKEAQKRLRSGSHLILLAQGGKGLRDLHAASTEAYVTGFYGKPRMDWDVLEEHGSDLIATTACLGGIIADDVQNRRVDAVLAKLGRLRSVFGDRLYLEVQGNELPEQRRMNLLLAEVSEALGIPMVATCDAHYPSPDDKELHRHWMACQSGKGKDDYWHFSPMLPEQALRDYLSYLDPKVVDTAIRNTTEIAARCDARIGGHADPPVFTPGGTAQDDARALRAMCESSWGLVEGLGRGYRDRMEREFEVVTGKGLAGCYLIVRDIIGFARSQGYLVGPGRGSAAGSLMSYLLEITSVDPLKAGLLFERFLTEGREALPDFDLDFPSSARTPIQEYAVERYGADHVVRVGTIMRYGTKGIVNKLATVFEDRYDGDVIADAKAIGKLVDQAEAGTAGLGLCLTNRSRVVLADGTSRYIGEIVRKRQPVEVLSVGPDGVIRPARVVNWYRNPRAGRKILRVSYESAPKLRHVYATEDHPVMTQRGWVRVSDLRPDDQIATGQAAPNPRQTDLIIGTMLGDACIVRRRPGVSRLQMAHGRKQEEWLRWKAERLLGLGVSVTEVINDGGYSADARFDARTASLGALDRFRDEFYPDGGAKRVPRSRFMALGPLGMAAWYLDDGSISRYARFPGAQPAGKIAICGFAEDAKWVVYEMNARGFDCALDEGDYPQIRFTVNGFRNFCDYIGAYVPPFMRYKLRDDAPAYDPLLCETGEPWVFYDRVTVEEDDRKPDPERGDDWVYDIEVEGSHNFVTPGGVVHNSWDEIMQDPEVTEYRGRYPELFDVAERLHGRVYAQGQHPAGLIISPGRVLTGTMPMRHANPGDKLLVSQWDYRAAEDLNLLKLDILTLRTLDTLQEAISLVEKRTGTRLNPRSWDVEHLDPQVYDAVDTGLTLGVFQLETRLCSDYSRRMRPRTLADLADLTTFIRPGPRNSGATEKYLARRSGSEEVDYPHPLLEEMLRSSYGVMLYQEDVMRACKLVAGYSDLEADGVRKILGKKLVSKIDAAGEEFVRRSTERGHDEQVVRTMWEAMAEFGRYAFNKAHGFSYGVLSYWTAWMKEHYPAEFLTAVMSTVDMDRLPDFAMEARRIGLAVLPPDVSYCQRGFTCQGITIRYGLLAIPRVGEAAVRKITAAQPYDSYEDFLARSGADAGVTHALAKAGALDHLVPSRKGLVRVIESDKDGTSVRCVHKADEPDGPGGLPCGYDWDGDRREQEERHAALMAPRLAGGRKPLKLALKLPPARCTRACRRYTPPARRDMAAWGEYPPDALFRSDMDAYGTWMSDAVFGRLDELAPGLREQAREMARALVTAAPGTYPAAAVLADVHSALTKSGSVMWWVTLLTEVSALSLACFSPRRDGDLDAPAMIRGLRPGTLVQAEVRKRSYVSKSGPRMGWNLAAAYPLGA